MQPQGSVPALVHRWTASCTHSHPSGAAQGGGWVCMALQGDLIVKAVRACCSLPIACAHHTQLAADPLPGEIQAGPKGAVKQAGMSGEWQQHPQLQCLPG